jgi:hypothetical protein
VVGGASKGRRWWKELQTSIVKAGLGDADRVPEVQKP